MISRSVYTHRKNKNSFPIRGRADEQWLLASSSGRKRISKKLGRVLEPQDRLLGENQKVGFQ
jgi:hypothetical protein